jgi:hypothetical protein
MKYYTDQFYATFGGVPIEGLITVEPVAMTDVQIILGLLRRVRAQERMLATAVAVAPDVMTMIELNETEVFVREAQELCNALEDD